MLKVLKNTNKFAFNYSMSSILEYKLRFDGCSKGNPGLAGAGAVIYYKDKEIWSEYYFIGKNYTNNYAEYYGLILGLTKAKDLLISNLCVEGDSQLVIRQMKGLYKCNSLNLKDLYIKAKNLETEFNNIEFNHIYRSNNKRADELANNAVDEYIKSKDK
jgi:ribonuclease HI